jgi:hypothetical protein
MLSPHTGPRVRWYAAFGGGIGTDTYGTSKATMTQIIATPGGEWRFGMKRNHGFAIELGWQSFNLKYEMEIYDFVTGKMETKETDINLWPIHIGLNYTYYF